MRSYRLFFWLSLTCLLALFNSLTASFEQTFPVLYKGRFRPVEAYARLWLYDIYHHQSLQARDLKAFGLFHSSPLDFLWKLHIEGHSAFEQAPLFWIQSPGVKRLSRLDPLRNRFSYQELVQALYLNPHSSQAILQHLIVYHFLQSYLDPTNRNRAEKIELTQLLPGLWVELDGSDLVIAAAPSSSPWPLTVGQPIARAVRQQMWQLGNKINEKVAEDLSALLAALQQFKELRGINLEMETAYANYFEHLRSKQLTTNQIESILEKDYPLLTRLKAAGQLFKALPGRNPTGEWFSLHALKVQVYHRQQNHLLPVGNFTLFSEAHFQRIRQTYLAWEQAMTLSKEQDMHRALYRQFTSALEEAFLSLAATPYQEAKDKALFYPSLNQLKAEFWYYQYPWIKILILLYSLSIAFLAFFHRFPGHSFLKKGAFAFLILAFINHTLLLLCRCYILSRPPVSNMFETVIYVPWVAVLGGLILSRLRSHALVLTAAALASVILLVVLDLTDLNHSLDPVQAVLDSQFWLIIHVLMVVGSYGIYLLGALLGHFYLGLYLYYRQETPLMKTLAQSILQTMYVGTALLIAGTILGGVWAAESWGRFWDWDPKESWAFVSSCLYLIWIHAYRFHRIARFGLALGSIFGLLAISFTWYGVNYILGTGLHSYGFGAGGESYYYGFLLGELLFLSYALCLYSINQRKTLSL